jgi:hypothetical protein
LLGASAHDYLHLFAITSLTFVWAKMASVAAQDLSNEFNRKKLITGEFFIQRILPQIDSLSKIIQQGSASMMQLGNNDF